MKSVSEVATAPTFARSSPGKIPGWGALEGNVVLVGFATFLLALGEGLWFRFAPRYLDALGASAMIIGLWGSLQDLLDSAWQIPGGILADRIGRKRTLLLLTSLTMIGLLVFLIPYWPVVLLGLVLYMANQAYAQPATFAVIGDALPKENRAMGFVVQSAFKRLPILLGVPAAGYVITGRLGIVGGVRAGLIAAFVLTGVALALQVKYYRSPPEAAELPVRYSLRNFPPRLRHLLFSDILIRMGESATKVFVVLYVVMILGYTDYVFGLMIALQTVVSLLVYIPAARAADLHGRKLWVALTFLFFGLFPIAILLARSFTLLLLAFVIGGLKEIGEPARKATIIDAAEQAQQRGRTVGAYYAARSLAIVPVGVAAGALWSWNHAAPFWLGGALSGVGLAFYVTTVRRE